MNMTQMIYLPGRNFVVRPVPTALATQKPWPFRSALPAAPLQTQLLAGPTGRQLRHLPVIESGELGRHWLH